MQTIQPMPLCHYQRKMTKAEVRSLCLSTASSSHPLSSYLGEADQEDS